MLTFLSYLIICCFSRNQRVEDSSLIKDAKNASAVTSFDHVHSTPVNKEQEVDTNKTEPGHHRHYSKMLDEHFFHLNF